MIINNLQFLKYVRKNKIMPALKTYADTLLFYYLGHLALHHGKGNILEIGVGGSTYALRELSMNTQSEFYAVDNEPSRIHDFINDDEFFSNSMTQAICIASTDLNSVTLKNISYVHIDGDKNYQIAAKDLSYAMDNLSSMGIICQDDYGNNKWPSITSAVHDLINDKKFQLLMVGDSSAWIVRKDDYENWMKILYLDKEFVFLRKFLNIADSSLALEHNPSYFFMNFFKNPYLNSNEITDKQEIEYYRCLEKYNHKTYLKMPYVIQSQPGRALFKQSWFKKIYSKFL